MQFEQNIRALGKTSLTNQTTGAWFTPELKNQVEVNQSFRFKLGPQHELHGAKIEDIAEKLLQREYGHTMIYTNQKTNSSIENDGTCNSSSTRNDINFDNDNFQALGKRIHDFHNDFESIMGMGSGNVNLMSGMADVLSNLSNFSKACNLQESFSDSSPMSGMTDVLSSLSKDCNLPEFPESINNDRSSNSSFRNTSNNLHSVFIPQEFISQLYYENISIFETSEGMIMKKLGEISKNLPTTDWFAVELDILLQKFYKNGKHNIINMMDWIRQIKILFVIHSTVNQSTEPYPKVKDKIEDMLKESHNFYQKQKAINDCGFKEMYRKYNTKKKADIIRKWIDKSIRALGDIPSHFEFVFHLSTDVRGEEPERWLFTELKDTLDHEESQQYSDKKFCILHGMDFLIPGGNIKVGGTNKVKKQQEIDFIIFAPNRKLVIAIEVKHILADEKAFEQLDYYKQIFEEKFGKSLEGWTYLPVVFEYQEAEVNPNPIHYINLNTNIKEWIDLVCAQFPPIPNSYDSYLSLQNVLKWIVFAFHVKSTYLSDIPGPIISSNYYDWVLRAINRIGTHQNIIFYSQQQLPILLSNHYKKLLLIGHYGSGKTIIMQKKAEMLAVSDKVTYLICTRSTKETLLQLFLKEKWKDNQNITVRALNPFVSDDLSEFKDSHVFIDEFYKLLKWKNNAGTKRIMELSKNSQKTVWIAVMRRHEIFCTTELFQTIELNWTFRNTTKISNFVGMYRGELMSSIAPSPSNFPEGGGVITLLDMKKTIPPFAKENALVIFYHSRPDDVVQVIKHCEDEGSKKIGLYTDSAVLNNSHLKYIVAEEDCLQFLRDGGILFVDVDLASGFEWKIVACPHNSLDNDNNNDFLNVYTRSVVKLYIYSML